MTSAYQEIDWNQYIFAGVALNASIQGLLIAPLLLTSDFRRNLLIVLANTFYLLSDFISFSASSINCDVGVYFIQLFIILGSICEVHTPLLRTYKLFDGIVKKAIPFLSASLTISIFCSLIGIYGYCGLSTSHFVSVHVNIIPDALASGISICVYILTFYKIINLVNSSEFGKENPKMQMIRGIAKYSMYFVIVVRLLMISFAIAGYDTNQKLTTALRSNLVVFLMIVQLSLELTKSASDRRDDEESISQGGSHSPTRSIGGTRRGTKGDFTSAEHAPGSRRGSKQEFLEALKNEKKPNRSFDMINEID